jgi:hypothetical protein
MRMPELFILTQQAVTGLKELQIWLAQQQRQE